MTINYLCTKIQKKDDIGKRNGKNYTFQLEPAE